MSGGFLDCFPFAKEIEEGRQAFSNRNSGAKYLYPNYLFLAAAMAAAAAVAAGRRHSHRAGWLKKESGVLVVSGVFARVGVILTFVLPSAIVFAFNERARGENMLPNLA